MQSAKCCNNLIPFLCMLLAIILNYAKELLGFKKKFCISKGYKDFFAQKKRKIKWGRCTSTNLSIWAALKTTSNSILSSSAAFFAISAASIRRDSSSRNWPAMECMNMSSQKITDVIHFRQYSQVKEAQKNPLTKPQTNKPSNKPMSQIQSLVICWSALFFNLFKI